MDVDETPQIWPNYLQGDDRELYRFLKYIQTNQTVKICSFGLVWWFLRRNVNKTEVEQYSCPCYKKLCQKTLSQKNLQRWLHCQRIVSRRNELAKYYTAQSFYRWRSLPPAWFINIYETESNVVNISNY